MRISVTQHFADVLRTGWGFQFGSYQAAHIWLKEHKGRLLTFFDLQHYSHVLAALASTIALQAGIDAAIDTAGGWPLG